MTRLPAKDLIAHVSGGATIDPPGKRYASSRHGDPHFLKVAEWLLNTGGGVLLARSAHQAKDLMRSAGGTFSLAMVDLDLPGQDGFYLIRELKRHFPNLPVIAISGIVQEGVLGSAMHLGAADTLQKPITPAWKATMARVCAGYAQFI
jgi:CheY-like chemotaxis protein